MGIDNGTDDNQHLLPPYEREDQRILRLEAEVAVWEGASHASWAQWAIVQARDAIINKVELFLKRGDSFQATTPTEEKGHAPSPNGLHLTRSGELRDADDALQLDADDELGEDVDFDYLRYALVSALYPLWYMI